MTQIETKLKPIAVSPVSGTAPPEDGKFKKGVSGNPGGMPKGTGSPGKWLSPLCEFTDRELRLIVKDARASRAKKMAAQILLDTADKSPDIRRRAVAEVWDRTVGKAVARSELSGPDGSPIDQRHEVKIILEHRKP